MHPPHAAPSTTVDAVSSLSPLSPSLRLRQVVFDGEEGVDAGGVRKEYFQVMMRELLDPNYGMFR